MIPDLFRLRVVAEALSLVGLPYKWGGNYPAKDGGLDCSGFVLHVWRRAGLDLADMTAQGLRDTCAMISAGDALPGDVAFYGFDPVRASHCVLILSPGGKAIIGANGGTSLRPNESALDYQQRMARVQASVRIEDHRKGGVGYRWDLLGVGRCPIPEALVG